MNNDSLKVRFRPEVASFPAYRQGAGLKRAGFKLSSNESPWQPLPAILKAVQETDTFNRYANPQLPELRDKLAAKFAVAGDQIQFGAGSVAILYQLIHAVAGPGDNYICAEPSFEAYPLLGLASGAAQFGVPLTADARLNLPAMSRSINANTRAVILCSPNNPTGPVITETEFLEFMAAVPEHVLVVLDEAYAEFVRKADAVDGMKHLAAFPNLVVLRTFAKAQGIAGLRLGYGFADAGIWRAAAATAIPLSVSTVAEVAGIAALSDEAQTQMRGRVQLIVNRREALLDGVRALGFNPPDAQGNFIWLSNVEISRVGPKVFGDPGAKLAESFRQVDILVRHIPGRGVRITVGEAESVDAVLNALKDYLAQHAGEGKDD
ncbi:aminotransferase class I/II-fold pyridoxal phosphate-dependent enzyme [Canibacter zhoujuaniae]|uniref:aminotransferase class I/II-fold pyridoxal phosphate-dependent enzyme n=1 Tax=Canibacter zhoujuaniae TaxID=2708343 RepID=UPI001420AF15|nr:aminotransferase class I/II-fold pyridoxal phosphate-dependent enzyme [Canibacter zhoujuaniae]